jgi:hypothetical protein
MVAQRNIQVCLMMDCTASMQPWITSATKTLTKSITNVKTMYPNDSIEVAFVGYRDVKDNEPFIVVPFTTAINLVVSTIKNIHAWGGHDLAEDVSGAYSIVNNLIWNGDVKVVFHVCDAPNHGLKYHQTWYDDSYPYGIEGIPLLEDTIVNMATQHIDINFLRLDYTTDIMVDVMEEAYHSVRETGFNEIPVVDQDYDKGTDYILETSLNQALFSSISMDPTKN